MKRLIAIVGLVTLVACGGGGGVSGPSAPAYPNVAGNYTGAVNVMVGGQYLGSSPVVLRIEQAGASVNVSGTSNGTPITSFSGTLSMDGVVTFHTVIQNATCGTLTGVDQTLRISGSTLTYRSLSTSSCGDWYTSGTLTRS